MSLLTKNSVIQRNPHMVSTKMDGDTVMMSIENGEYYGLNPIAGRIWELIEKPVSIDRLINHLLDEFEVTLAECETDTLEFLEQLHGKDLLSVIP